MKTVTEKAYGKLNLTLDVLGTRPDGYHEMEMIMQTVDLCDEVSVCLPPRGSWRCICSESSVPQGQDNLAMKSAEAFFAAFGTRPEHLSIHIQKRIPMQGGMAGGSADAAAVLRALNEIFDRPFSLERLADIGGRIGSDVPFCVLGGTVLATGRGEILSPLSPLPPCWFVLVQPPFSVSTPSLFRELDLHGVHHHPKTAPAIHALSSGDLSAFVKNMHNVFQPVLVQSHPEISAICDELYDLGALKAMLTGTGSVVFGLFAERAAAKEAHDALMRSHRTFLARSV